MTCSRIYKALVGTLSILVASSHATRAANNALELVCAELSQSMWSSTDVGNHALIMPSLGAGLVQISTHSIKVDFSKKIAIIDQPGENTNNPALGEVGALAGPEFISISNVLPSNHADGVTKLEIRIDRRTRTLDRKSVV